MYGVVGRMRRQPRLLRCTDTWDLNPVGNGAEEGESPVKEPCRRRCHAYPSTTEPVELCGNLGAPSSKAKYFLATDSGQVP